MPGQGTIKAPWGDEGRALAPVPFLFTAGAYEDALLTLAKMQRELDLLDLQAIERGEEYPS